MIHVSTPGNDAVPDPGAPTDGDRRDPGDTPARTAVQLDPDLAMAVLASLISSTVSRGRTLVVVTHDPSVAAACSRLVRVRDGRIESDTAQRPAQPASEGTVR